MIFNMTGGAGGRLNLTVTGGTARPASPKENTVWVNTATAITGWTIGYEKPASPAEGHVWLPLAGITPASLVVAPDKKSALSLNLTSANQYVSGSWQSKPTEAYVKGAWKNLAMLVLENGAFCYGDQSMFGHWADAGSIAFSSTDTAFSIASSSGGTHTSGFLFDFTNYSKLRITMSYTIRSGSPAKPAITIKYQVANGNIYALYNLYNSGNIASAAKATREIDISSITGENYVCVSQVDNTTVFFYDIAFLV